MQIRINQMRLLANVGVTEKERDEKQEVIISVDVSLPFLAEMLADKIDTTLDYRAIAEVLQKNLSQKRYRLIEKMAHDLIKEIQALSQSISEITIEIEKTMTRSFRFARSVSVKLSSSEVQKIIN